MSISLSAALATVVATVLRVAVALGRSTEQSTQFPNPEALGVALQAFFAVLALAVTIALAAPRILDWRRAFVRCSLEISGLRGCAVAKLALENPSVYRREVHWACLVVSGQGIDFLELIRKHIDKRVKITNNVILLKNLECHEPMTKAVERDLCIIPLPFFYCEQVGIRDEKVTYSVLLNNQGLAPGYYDVRFFVFPSPKLTKRFGYHRCIHTVCHLAESDDPQAT